MFKNIQTIPQIVSLVKVTKNGKIKLRKAALQHLEPNHRQLNLEIKSEILLSTDAKKGKRIQLDEKNCFLLPEDVQKKLQIEIGTLIGLVERDGALAIKKIDIIETEGEQARWLDIETTYRITRTIETNPMPEPFIAKLTEQYRNVSLKYDVRAFLRDRQTLEAWMARRILGTSRDSDEALREQLIENRLNNQHENSSWENQVPITARNLRELADLGMTRKDKEIRKAINWLIDRPESVYNPGLWFAADELVEEQAQVIKRRQKHKGKGAKERFNQRMSPEVNLIRAAEPLACHPCGPRIMWTTALVMEALLRFGCEDIKRVKKAIHTLTINSHWCDNTYQHGLSGWERIQPPSIESIEVFKKYFIEGFRHGGICNPQELLKASVSNQILQFGRIAHNSNKGSDEYLLFMLEAGEGCNIIMVRALSRVRNEKLKKILELYLWRYTGYQNFKDGTFSIIPDRIFTDMQILFLQIFSSYDYPISKLAILRALPWIIKNQNKDGSWGTELVRDITTYAVINALVSLGSNLPSGCIP